MDEFNRDFDPIDEYPSIDDNTKKSPDIAAKFGDDNDVFTAFERAQQNTPAPQPIQNVPPQPQPYMPHTANTLPYQPQNQQPVFQQTGFQQYNTQNPVGYNTPPYMPAQPQFSVAPQTGYTNPYAQNANNTKQPTPTKTKVLIGVLCFLLILSIVGYAVLLWPESSEKDNKKSDNPLSEYGATEGNDSAEEFDDFDFGFDDGFGFSQQYNGESYDTEIILQADEGETQERSDDKKDNTYAPDKNVSDIKLKSLPKDTKNSKYTAQSAYKAVTDSVVSVVCYDGKITDKEEDIMGEGTGTIISSDGYIITNSHVIGDSKYYTINIVLNNADEYEAKIVGFDARTDLAVLKIDAKGLTAATLGDSAFVEVGQDIIAIGNPGGQSFQNSLTKGIVSAVDRELDLSQNVTYIQLDAAINPGNSGGPLCNIYGQVIGINTAKISSQEYEGMGFAIPSATVAEIANDLIHYGYVKDRVRLGLMGTQVDDEMAYMYNVPYGILISEISKGGPLDNGEIEQYDILTAIDGKEVSTFQDVYGMLENYKPGDKITLTLYRLEY